MGSPGIFIHSGTLGGRFSEFSVAANASLPARPLTTAPPINAPPRRKNLRRAATGRRSLAMLVGLVIVRPPLSFKRKNSAIAAKGHGGRCCQPANGACLIALTELDTACRR